MKELFEHKNQCCGCTACINICPKKAIAMHSDEEGFEYPQIDSTKCIDCGLCKKVCAFQAESSFRPSFEQQAYAAKHKNDHIRMNSSSGGLFSAISDLILSMGGVVYGAAFDEEFNVVHQRAETPQQCAKFRGSKYVQSDLNTVFDQINKDLLSERKVLFTGTPCQCAGLKNYLNYSHCTTDNLIICDLVCHGVPSPILWRDHIKQLTKKGEIQGYYCRPKEISWHASPDLIVYKNGKRDYRSPLSQEHKTIYYTRTALRPSCHSCKYTTTDRVSDITIADFWGIEKSMPEFDDEKGISLVLLNSNKGLELFHKIKGRLEYKASPIEQCLQPQLIHPTAPSVNRERFWQDYQKHGYVYITKKYANVGFIAALKRVAKKILNR